MILRCGAIITSSSSRALGSFKQKLAARGPFSGFFLFKQLTIIFRFEDWVKRWLIPMEQDWPPALRLTPQPTQTLTRVRVKAWQASTACPACLLRSTVLLLPLGTLQQRDLAARGPPTTGGGSTLNSRHTSIAKCSLRLSCGCVRFAIGPDNLAPAVLPAHGAVSGRASYLSLSTAPSAPGGAIDSWKGVLK